MTREEAIRILNLNNDYNLDILRKQYYKMAKQYHPDIVSNLTEEIKIQKMQEINSAYELLKSQFKSSNSSYNNTKNHNRTSVNYNYNSYRKKETFEQRYFKKTILDFIKTEIIDLKQLEGYCDIHNQTFISQICRIYLREYQYIANKIDEFGRHCKFDLKKSSIFFSRLRREIMKDAYLEYEKRINCFTFSDVLQEKYSGLWEEKKNLILNSKNSKIAIICFMKIVKDVADIELKGEMSLYLDKNLKKIEMIIVDYCNYAFYDVLKWQILSIKKYAVEKIIDISLRESDCELIRRKVDRIIKNMQEEIEVVFEDYANKLEVNRKINIYPKKNLTNLKSRFIKIQKSFQNKTIFKKKNT